MIKQGLSRSTFAIWKRTEQEPRSVTRSTTRALGLVLADGRDEGDTCLIWICEDQRGTPRVRFRCCRCRQGCAGSSSRPGAGKPQFQEPESEYPIRRVQVQGRRQSFSRFPHLGDHLPSRWGEQFPVLVEPTLTSFSRGRGLRCLRKKRKVCRFQLEEKTRAERSVPASAFRPNRTMPFAIW